MGAAALILAAWLMPVAWLEVSARLVDRGAEGLWLGLALTLAPLLALNLGSRAAASPPREREPLFPVLALLLVVSMLLWAQIALAAEVAAWAGGRRWIGIAITAGAGWLLAGSRQTRRAVPALLVVAIVSATLPLVELARLARVGPLGAWERVASQSTFAFPPSSPWVTGGHDLKMSRGRAVLAFDEEHRVTTPAGGTLRVRAVDGSRISDIDWELAPGQWVTLRPGDQLQPPFATPMRFEAGRSVPGAPSSGITWAAGQTPTWAAAMGLLVTILLGAVALLRSGPNVHISRRAVTLVGGGLVGAFLWAQGWATYSVLSAPDLWLGGVSAERLLDVQGFALRSSPWRRPLELLLLAGGAAAFLASSVALRERIGGLDRRGGGQIGRDLGLWGAVFGVAAVASLWPADPWALTLLALGAAASSLAPGLLWPDPKSAGPATAAGLVGLVVFGALAGLAQFRGPAPGPLGALLTYPALAAVPAGAVALWLGRRLLARS